MTENPSHNITPSTPRPSIDSLEAREGLSKPIDNMRDALGRLVSSIRPNPDQEKKMIPSDMPIKNEWEYREKYGVFTDTLGKQFGLWNGNLINAVVRKESVFWNQLLHNNSGSTGIMMLTSAPFRDMMESHRIGRVYAPVFSWLDVSELKSIPFGQEKSQVNGTQKTIGETLPGSVWMSLNRLSDLSEIIQSPNEKNEAQMAKKEFADIIQNLSRYEMKDRGKYFKHTLNLVIWSAYLAQLNTRYRGNIKTIAERYNGNTALWKNGEPIYKTYARDISRYYKQESTRVA